MITLNFRKKLLALLAIGFVVVSCSDATGADEDEGTGHIMMLPVNHPGAPIYRPTTDTVVIEDLDTIRIIDTLILKDTANFITRDTVYSKDTIVTKDTVVVTSLDIEDILDSLQNIVSPFNKGKDFGTVPTVMYDGLLNDYSWGGENTTYEEIITKFDELLVPNYSSKESIGFSSDNQELFVYKFTPALPTVKITGQNTYLPRKIPTIMIMCGQHGYEKGSIYGTWHFLKDVITNSGKNEFLRYIRKNVNIYVVPAANPWGIDNNNYLNANGVNLNRNWDVDDWKYISGASNPTQASGDKPFDQPETRAISNFVIEHKDDIDLFIDHHTNGGAININADTKKNGIQELNWLSLTLNPSDEKDPFYDRMMEICFAHSLNITSLFSEAFSMELLGLNGTEGEETRISNISYESPFPKIGYSDAWAINQKILAICLEGFNGFPTGEIYSDEVKQGMSMILGNFLQTALQILSE